MSHQVTKLKLKVEVLFKYLFMIIIITLCQTNQVLKLYPALLTNLVIVPRGHLLVYI